MTTIRGHSNAAIRQGSRSFAAAARLLPPQQFDSAVMLYAWCRHCDDAIDGQVLGRGAVAPTVTQQQVQLAHLREETCSALDSDVPVAAPFEALREVVRRHGIPQRHPMELLDGFEMDVSGRSYRTIEDTLDYAYHVAGVVGVMMGMVLGVRNRSILDRACDLGIAFQLTNIARDVMEDRDLGRSYLPGEWLAVTGAPSSPASDDDLRRYLYPSALRLLDCAEPYYASARIGAAGLPSRTSWAILSALSIYREIGIRLRSRGPEAWNDRISVPGHRKASLMAMSLFETLRLKQRPATEVADRSALWTRP